MIKGQKEVNEGRYFGAGAGTNTAALFYGGQDPGLSPVRIDNTELWNGSSWTETTEFNQAKYGAASGGTTTASLVF